MKTIKLIITLAFLSTLMQAQKPNIILIESDDQSNLAVGAYGWGDMHTPNIDKLAEKGTYFTNAYNMGCWSPAVCIPSRTMLFNGVFLWDAARINVQQVPGPSLVERLNDVGYTSYFTGKWHALGHRPQDMFDHTGHILPGQLKTYNTEEGHLTNVVGKEAVNFIHKAAKEEAPYFLYVAFNAPHVPRQTAQSYYEMYPTESILLPPSVQDGPLHPSIKYNYSKDPLSSQEMKGRYQQNNAMVTHMDDRIGDILEALKETEAYDNSIIVFMSDQGINFGENGVAGKVCLYDMSAKAPLIICVPEMMANTKFNERIYLQDLYPTILELIGEKVPDYMDFKSLAGIINGSSKQSPHRAIYMGMLEEQRGIVYDDYKLIMYTEDSVAELYNLKKDRWEIENIITEASSQRILKELADEFLKCQIETHDTLDISGIFPQIFE